jgi:pimeloyl-[acyl-carrier protein] methyl ester esterase
MLHSETAGNGPDLVLLHGWGMHSGIWGEWLGYLRRCFRVTLVDLPGHGRSDLEQCYDLNCWAEAVLAVAPARAWWVGWSLGGLVALAAAEQAPVRLRGLVLLAATPRFVAGGDWKSAVSAEVFRGFAQNLEDDSQRALARFLALQVRGAEQGSNTLRRLRSGLRSRPAADPQALRIGLDFLQWADLRRTMSELDLPLFWLLGERDTLVPARLAREISLDGGALIAGAGHAPFLSHPRECAEFVTRQLVTDREHHAHAAD